MLKPYREVADSTQEAVHNTPWTLHYASETLTLHGTHDTFLCNIVKNPKFSVLKLLQKQKGKTTQNVHRKRICRNPTRAPKTIANPQKGKFLDWKKLFLYNHYRQWGWLGVVKTGAPVGSRISGFQDCNTKMGLQEIEILQYWVGKRRLFCIYKECESRWNCKFRFLKGALWLFGLSSLVFQWRRRQRMERAKDRENERTKGLNEAF